METATQNPIRTISVFSKHLLWLDLNGMAETAAKIGFDGVDLTVRPNGHVEPERVEADLPRAAEACAKAEIEIEMICTSIGDASLPTTEKILKTASQLGIEYYRMDWYHYDETKSIDNNLEYFKALMRDLAALNEHYKIKGAYQNHDGTWFGAPVWDLALILRDIDSEWLGCQYDILNASIEGCKSWPLGFEFIAPYIHTIDIKDAVWRRVDDTWEVDYTALGEGNVDFRKFFQFTSKFNIQVPFSLHVEYDLGGADVGAHQLTIPEVQVIAAIKRDLNTLRGILT